MRRRAFVCGASAAMLGQAAPAASREEVDPPTGWVAPRTAAPAWPLRLAGGGASTLPRLLAGGPTAVQLMFTGCTTSCPLQGMRFAALAARPRRVAMRWLSISIDALGDDPPRLLAWQRRFGENARWRAAVPAVGDVDAVNAFLRGAPVHGGTHTDQVFVFDAAARLAYRTGDAPPDEFLERLFDTLA